MSVLRGLLFDNLGLKLVALLMALLVYLNVYTDRPAVMLVSFPLVFEELADTLSFSGPVPGLVQAELRGTGKQLIRLRLTEPRVRVSLAGATAGRLERALGAEDLPLEGLDGIQMERLVGPRVIELQIEPLSERRVPVRIEVAGEPAMGFRWNDLADADPRLVTVRGPRPAIAGLDTVVLAAVQIDGRRDTVRAQVTAAALPTWCTMEPASVEVTIPIVRGR